MNASENMKILSNFRTGVGSCIKRVTEIKRPLVITQHDKSAAVLVNVGEFEEIQMRLELLEDIYTAETQIDEGRGVSNEDAKAMILERL